MLGIFRYTKEVDTEVNDKLFDELDLSLFQTKNRKKFIIYLLSIWGMVLLKVILYFSDLYTCVKLLAFNTWSNEYFKPFLPFKISKWLFSGCIIFSLLLLIWEGVHGLKVYQTGNIVYGYANGCSRTIYCIQDYRVFCLFDKVTPSGYLQRMSFFTFFELKNCFRLIFADSPRQVINGLTLWSLLTGSGGTVTNSDANENSTLQDISNVDGIFDKINVIAKTNREEAIILCFMLLSFVIWMMLFFKFCVAFAASIPICYKFKKDIQFKNITEYIYITISYNLDYLTEKYKFKHFYSQTNLLGNSDTDSELIFDSEDDLYYHSDKSSDIELSRISFLKTPDTLYSVPSYYYNK